MKVKYLIKKLKKYDPETEVVLERPNLCFVSIRKIEELEIVKKFWDPILGVGEHMNARICETSTALVLK